MVRKVGHSDIGIKVLREPPEDTQEPIDIVAIHGIGAHPDDTWTTSVTAENGEVAYISWLTEQRMLPAVATNARIMRYGYKSSWFGKEPMQAKVTDVATRLLDSLTMKREDFPYRPLILITHCFGGLVALKASVLARNDDDEWKPIFKSTIGLLTLGTPFRGADGMQHRDIVEAALREYTEEEVRSETIEILQRENQTLNDLVAEFCKVHKREGQAQIACFYETGYTNVGKVVGGQNRIRLLVTESSGRLDFADNRSIARDHFEMNKFEDPDEEDFMFVMKALKKMIKGSTNDGKLFANCKNLLYQPETTIADANIKAFDSSIWLFQHETFRKWKEASTVETLKSRLLTLKGNPGTSKTVIMKEAANWCRGPGTIVLRHHFARYETETSSLPDQLHTFYRSLLFQLLELSAVQPRQFLFEWAEEVKFQTHPSLSYWSKERLKSAIHEIVFSSTSSTYRVFIDALDACDIGGQAYFPTHSREVLLFITETLSRASRVGVDVRICLSRRHHPYHGREEPDTLTIVVEDNIQQVVEDFIESKLQDIEDRGARELVFHRLARHRIREFCWPQKVIDVVRSADKSTTHNGILDLVDKEFSELERGVGSPGYGHDSILDTEALDNPETIRLLQIATAARLPMTLAQIRHALAFSGPRGPRDIRKWEESNDAWQSGEIFENYVRQKSYGLLEVHRVAGGQPTVRFTHPAVEGLVQHQCISASIQPSEWKQQSHFALLQLCFGALEQSVDLFLSENVTFPFLDYAFEHWVYHTRMTGKLIHSLKRLPRFLGSCVIKKAQAIIECHIDFLLDCRETAIIRREELEVTTLVADCDSILVLLASYGCSDAVERHLVHCTRCKSASLQLGEGEYRKAIDNAIIAGFPETAEWLLEHYSGRDIDSHRMDQTLLFRASYKGYLNVVDALLDKGADPMVASYIPYEYPLHVAIEFGFEDLVLKLIDNSDERILRVKCQPYGKTALHVAIQSRHPTRKMEVLQSLLEKILDKFPDIAEELSAIPDKAAKTPLQLIRDACAEGHIDADRLKDEFIIFLGREDWYKD